MEMNKSERSPDMQKVTLETPDRKTPQNMLGSCFDQLFQYSPVVGRYICPLGLSKNWKNRSSGLTFIISISWDFLILRIRFPRRGALENSILSSAESLLRRSSLYKLHEDVLSFNLHHRETASGLPGKTYYFFLPSVLARAGTFVVLVPVSDREIRKSTAIFMYAYTVSPLARILFNGFSN